MKNKKLFQKIVLIALAVAVFIALVAPAIFSQTPSAPKQEKLLNGLKVLMWSDAAADKVTIKIRIHAGAAFDPQGREGVMQLLADNIFPNPASREFFAEDLGGGLEIVTNYDYIQINASSKPENFLTMLETLSAAVSNPSIDNDTTVRLRNALLTKVASLEADPSYVADRAVAKRLFGTFPYGRSQYGTADSLKKIDFADLTDAKGRFLTADNATIIISGNFDRALGLKAIRRYFGGWLKADKKVPSTFKQPDEPDTKKLTLELPNLENTYSRFAMVAPARGDKDYFAMQILVKLWRDQFNYNDKNDFECGRNHYQTNLLFGVYSHSQSRPIPKNGELRINGRNICGSQSSKNVDGVYPYAEIKQADFDKAKAFIFSDFNQRIQTTSGLSDLWLDLDTFKLLSVDAESRKLDSVTLSNVNALVERFRKTPMVSVLVTSTVTTN
ncbi:MAG: pitrilysin family protein [Pyrinomonadaceae bacterium]